tara:strand:+ start:1222 stop:1401 length:180 start_codon:yes stop_codon:yes gene_type:complete
MRKIIYKITKGDESELVEFITDRTPEWTEKEYSRNREPLTMELISNEATKETEAVSREI